MKKLNKKKIIILIGILIFVIFGIISFRNSRGEKTIEIQAEIIDNENIINMEITKIEATNEEKSGISVILPEFINSRKIKRFIIEEKEIIESTNTVNSTDINTSNSTSGNTTKIEKIPGEKIYLSEEEVEKLKIQLTVEYDYIEVNSNKLYNKKLTLENDNQEEVLSVFGYMPDDTKMEIKDIDPTYLEEINQNYPNNTIIGNYDIKLITNETEYIPRDYEQTLEIQITLLDQNKTTKLFEIENEKITQIQDITIEEGKIKLNQEQLKAYIVLQQENEEELETNDKNNEITLNDEASLFTVGGENTTLTIDDYESDKNYYLGLNYTENNSKNYTGKYTETNLKEVVINYYGYDYDLTEFTTQDKYEVSLGATAIRSQTGTISQSGSGNNRRYSRTDTISVEVSGINNLRNQYPDFNANSNWTMQIQVPSTNFSDYFYEEQTNEENVNNGITVSINNGIMTVNGNDATPIESSNDTWTFTFKVTFYDSNRNNVNNISFNTLTVNSFSTTIAIGEYTPYGTISDTEEQTSISYRKCVPVDSNGNITIELIDNPFMNRPIERGFNGWKTNDTRYSNSISTNRNNFIQTLTTNINNIKDENGNYVINLYVDWIEANVVFVSSSGSNSNSGTSPNSPISNDWNSISSKINSNIKTCTNASNREANIVVLMQGTLSASELSTPNTPYTLTSLYDGVNYGNTNTYLNIGTTNVYLDSDLQINDIYVYTSRSYTSPTGTTDGTSTLSPCLYGNMYNVRIGRGVVSTNTNNCVFSQIQGGYYNHESSEYKLVIETGKYLTVQLYRAVSSSRSTTTNGTLVMGNDIDRNNKDNDSLKIYNRMSSKTTTDTNYPYTEGNSKAIVINMIVKSGTFGIDFFNKASTSDSSDRNYAGIYVGGHGNTGHDKSDRYLLVEGGNIANIIGGLNVDEEDMYKTYMYIKDGNILNITGGAGYTHTYGDRIIQVTGGFVKYSISGGSNGVAASSASNNGQLTGEALIYVGGDAQIGASSTIDGNGNEVITVTDKNEVLYGVNAGSVCGGANGNNKYAGQTDGSYIIIDENAIVHNNVFGGGNYGIIGSSDIQVPGLVTYINETPNFTTNKEYYIATSNYGRKWTFKKQ